MELTQLLKNKRKSAGLSLKKLSALCQISDSEISKIEHGGRQKPSWENLCKIARALDCHPFEFLLAAGYISEDDIHPVERLRGLCKLTQAELGELQSFIDYLIYRKSLAKEDETTTLNNKSDCQNTFGKASASSAEIVTSLPDSDLDLQVDCQSLLCNTFQEHSPIQPLSEEIPCLPATVVPFRLGELFCGPGGLAWGALHANIGDPKFIIEHEWASDYDGDTCETYRFNICRDKPESVYCEDVRSFDMNKLSSIDALAFGFPCNDYSIVGEQKGMDGEYGPLYTYGVKALRVFRPLWFVAENVGGLKSANEGNSFKRILSELKDSGYIITPHLYKFEEYGIPQARHRIIIVGIREDLNVKFKVPSPDPFANIDNSCRSAIENPPIPYDAFNNEPTAQSAIVVERLKHILPGQNAFTADLPEELRLNIKGARISQIYKRLDPLKPSYTVTGSGGGGTHIYHWKEPRALTNRERARLQTFPDDFKFIGSKESVRRQIGMAVPCKGAQIIFEAILRCFAGLDYPSIVPNIDSGTTFNDCLPKVQRKSIREKAETTKERRELFR